jgi:hypothetical protein
MIFDRWERLLLIFFDSVSLIPSALVILTHSEPAKSTMLSLLIRHPVSN